VVEPPQDIYSIQLGAFPGAGSANTRKAELQAIGFDPLKVVNEDSFNKILFGEFEYYLDAFIYLGMIKSDVDPNAFIEALPNTEKKNDFDPPQSPYVRVFSPPESNLNAAQDYTLSFNDALTSPLLPYLNIGEEKGFIPTDVARAKPMIENVALQLPGTDPRKGWAFTRLGAIALSEGHYATARQYFYPVVNGTIKARRLDRIKAMRRVAWTLHMEGDRIGAYRAYREVERFTGSDLVRAIARVECAGLLMEMARSAKGSLDDCRRECQKVLDTCPERFRSQRATAALMYFESYYFEKAYERVAELGQQFLAEYKDCPREYSAALCMTAQALGKLERYQESLDLLLELYEMDISPEDQFYHFDLRKWAVGWIVWIYQIFQDQEKADQWRPLMDPNWKRTGEQ
jgi:hypothetical protein